MFRTRLFGVPSKSLGSTRGLKKVVQPHAVVYKRKINIAIEHQSMFDHSRLSAIGVDTAGR